MKPPKELIKLAKKHGFIHHVDEIMNRFKENKKKFDDESYSLADEFNIPFSLETKIIEILYSNENSFANMILELFDIAEKKHFVERIDDLIEIIATTGLLRNFHVEDHLTTLYHVKRFIGKLPEINRDNIKEYE